ncbi:MAG: GNAT family N-acetyltransferase [Bacteroidetes bacterium]|nr:GNAT family N-acetyltransferase [Bacteroidota bacterium]
MLRIVPYTEERRDDFRLLNEEWLRKYFTLEPLDIELLSQPEKNIIAPGGAVFFAELEGRIVGTAAMIPHGEREFELGKMAVTEAVQGRGVGAALMERCITFAREKNAASVILYSNTKLASAIHLYRKYGFVEIPLQRSGYVRTNIMMEKRLGP